MNGAAASPPFCRQLCLFTYCYHACLLPCVRDIAHAALRACCPATPCRAHAFAGN
jgi:hypothetical protein